MIGYVYCRLAWTMLRTLWQRWRRPDLQLNAFGEVSTPIRIWPNDLDSNMHLNNGRYLTLMDIGRFDFTARTPLLNIMIKHRWYPVLAGVIIRFRKPLNVFERVELKTQLVWWDERWIYLEQRFERNGEICARALLKAVFRKGKQSLPTAALLEALGKTGVAPPAKPEAITHWEKADSHLR